jgi:hypothetical protein
MLGCGRNGNTFHESTRTSIAEPGETVKRYIEVVEYESGNVIHKVDVSGKPERIAEKVMDGMDRNLNHEKFYTRFAGSSAASQPAKESK